jgi:hypothetical protein
MSEQKRYHVATAGDGWGVYDSTRGRLRPDADGPAGFARVAYFSMLTDEQREDGSWVRRTWDEAHKAALAHCAELNGEVTP